MFIDDMCTQTNGSSSEEQSLRESLEEEREAVLDFLYTIIDCVSACQITVTLDILCKTIDSMSAFYCRAYNSGYMMPIDDLFLCTMQNMAPWQEAQCDVAAHPWWPCLWTMCNTLAARSKNREPPDTLKAAEGGAGLFPQYCAAELLQQPMLARGGGLQLKRE